MGLIRGVARTAVVAGTATAVSNGVSRRQYSRWAAKEQQTTQAAPEPVPAAAPAPAVAAPAAPAPASTGPLSMDDKIAQLKQLGQLHDAGVLTEEEFAAQKSKVLGG